MFAFHCLCYFTRNKMRLIWLKSIRLVIARFKEVKFDARTEHCDNASLIKKTLNSTPVQDSVLCFRYRTSGCLSTMYNVRQTVENFQDFEGCKNKRLTNKCIYFSKTTPFFKIQTNQQITARNRYKFK